MPPAVLPRQELGTMISQDPARTECRGNFAMNTNCRSIFLVRIVSTAVILAGAATTLSAQSTGPGLIGPATRPERPYRGLFGGGSGDASQSLTVEASFGGGFVENPVVEQGGAAPVDPSRTGGGSGTGSASISYSMDRKRFGLYANHKSLVDYYPQLGQNSTWDRHFVSANIYYLPSPSTRIAVMPAFKNVPELSASDLFDPEFDPAIPLPLDPALTLARYHRYGATLEASHKLSARTRLEGDVNYGHGKIGANKEWVIFTGSVGLSHSLTKGIALFVGYREGGQHDIVAGAPSTSERQPRINAGIDFNQPLSLTRRTLVTFSTGVAGTQQQTTRETTYHLIGSAQIIREFGRTWNASLSYNRGIRRVEPLGEAILTDSTSGGVQGSFSERIQFQTRFGYAKGTVESTDGDMENTFGGVQVSFAINKILAWSADYSYYKYSANERALPLVVIGTRNSSSVRTYLELWLPLFTRTKRE
jgi:hypothetical protein